MDPQQQYGFVPTPPQVAPTNQKSKLLFIGLGALLLLSIILVIASLSTGNKSGSLFIRAIGYQREQLRLNDLAEDFAENDSVLTTYQANLKALASSDLVSLETAYGKTVKDQQIVDIVDNDIETRFNEAGQTNNFKDEYKETLHANLSKSIETLMKLRAAAKSDHRGSIDVSIANQKSLLNQLDKL